MFLKEAPIAPADDFFHGTKVVVADEGFNFEPTVLFAIGLALVEAHHGGDTEAA